MLVNDGDVFYLCRWMRESGLADLLPSLQETVCVGSGFFTAVGEQLATPGLAVEQFAQKAGNFALTDAGTKQPPTCARWRRDEPGSRGFRHVRWIRVKSTFFNACKSHVCILRVNDPRRTQFPLRGDWSPQGVGT